MKEAFEIQRDVLAELRWEPGFDAAAIGVAVHDGVTTLSGHVRSLAERRAGVKGVTNLVHVRPEVTSNGIEEHIRNAFRRHAEADADRVFAETVSGEVTLRGRVRSWAEYQDAEWAAWSMPGVVSGDNRLEVEPDPEPAEPAASRDGP